MGAFGLVAAVEGAIEQIRVSTEHVLVEAPRYLVDVAGDGSEGCLDDGPGSIGKHGSSSPVSEILFKQCSHSFAI
ncbi:MAG TPA: hypothetical protein VF163_10620, partial [Micromonosporaceae bacterium]